MNCSNHRTSSHILHLTFPNCPYRINQQVGLSVPAMQSRNCSFLNSFTNNLPRSRHYSLTLGQWQQSPIGNPASTYKCLKSIHLHSSLFDLKNNEMLSFSAHGFYWDHHKHWYDLGQDYKWWQL